MGATEHARYWQHPRLPGVDLLRARYVSHTFSRHAHDGFVIAAVTSGVEGVGLPRGAENVGAGGVVLINPETPHTAYAGAREGWSYRVLYPPVGLVAEVAAEVTPLRGTPSFTENVLDDPGGGRLIADVHRAAEADNALAADTLLRRTVARLLRRCGSTAADPSGAAGSGAAAAARARELLVEHMADPPTLERLAAATGTGPFALLRAFRAAYGLPPHSWLTGARVRRARQLLDAGCTPAGAAAAVGFTDQPHLNRHFTRIVGVPPGAYQRERRRTGSAGRGDGGTGSRGPSAREPWAGTAGAVSRNTAGEGFAAGGPPGGRAAGQGTRRPAVPAAAKTYKTEPGSGP
ncbi:MULTISPECIES: AraC family transcriptional regulator [Streptomyces]|uniref:AraC family transcriptional regulator n=1 Tax=Streptomyces lycii TaxID=2654337 RepID=A0ABQ7F9Y3_9ACTN|nr:MULTISPECIES: AraC family transcriptional regulator [Streptomyces]KAF4405198.1 AraC family transcriptional regulator [Streptomyces lycii]PGH52439.1 AraC family transcriptional regulator [Streptomyces sp. Ru87]